MKRYGSKLMALLLVIMLFVQNFSTYVAAGQGQLPMEKDGHIARSGGGQEVSDMEQDLQGAGQVDPSQELASGLQGQVRVIVELQGEPVIQKAIQQGIPYAQLPDQVIKAREAELALEQKAALDDLGQVMVGARAKEAIDISNAEVVHYSSGFNGLAMTVDAKDIASIEHKPYVKRVYVAEEYQRPYLNHSNQMIGSDYVWETKGLKGDGIVVAVIDTGIDFSHEAMVLDHNTKARYNQAQIEALIAENGLKGKYYNQKVPYGYNYYDHNDNTFDTYGYMHGMHVAGIVGANKSKGGQVNGVAPNVQLLALKVFSDDIQYPTTFTDIWLKALDDAIALKADVINMSLGSAAGIVGPDKARPEDEALRRANAAGIVVAVAAGNDGNILTGNYYKEKALAENPDTGLVSSPSLWDTTISVASVDNTVKYVNNLRWTDSQGQDHKAPINIRMSLTDPETITGSAIHLGLGHEADYVAKEVKDKIVLLSMNNQPQADDDHDQDHQAGPGPAASLATGPAMTMEDGHQHGPKKGMTLEERVKLAETKGAKAILLYNSQAAGERLGNDLKNIYPLFKTTLAIVGYEAGQAILRELEVNANLALSLSSVLEEESAKDQGRVSVFSSWGPSPDLRIKPEVAAPGGNIYSSLEDDQYRNMSGTSMASPHVAGAAAILKQYLLSQGISGQAAAEEIKLRLMNTAKPVLNDDNQVDFVRKQGAGLIQLDRAIETQVLARISGGQDQTLDGKLELLDLREGSFQAHLVLENRSAQEKNYSLSMVGIIEPVENGRLLGYAQNIPKFAGVRKIIRLGAGQSLELNIPVDFSRHRQIRPDAFIEGYFILEDISPNAHQVDLSLPFLAYYGDWSKPKAIDAFGIKEIHETTKRQAQFIVNKTVNAHSSMFATRVGLDLPVINDSLYFLPDLAKQRNLNYYESFGVRMAPLRNMTAIEYSILDGQTKEVVKVLGESRDIRKLNRLAVRPSYVYMPESFWKGDLNGKQIPDEKEYIYQIKVSLNDDRHQPSQQIYQYRVKADTLAPVFSPLDQPKLEAYQGNRKKITFSLKDTGSGIDKVYLQSMYFRSRQADENGDHRVGTPAEIGENPNLNIWKPFYGKSLKIDFVRPENMPKKLHKPALKVVNGKVTIPPSYLPTNLGASGEVYVEISDGQDQEIQVETYYDADDAYLGIFASDWLSNREVKYLITGANPQYSLNFFNYYNNITPNKGIIWVNGEKIDNFSVSTLGPAKIKIEFPDKNAKLSFLRLDRYDTRDILIENGKIKEENREKYGVKEGDYSWEFTVEAKLGEINIITGVQKEGTVLSIKEVDFSKFDLGLFFLKTTSGAYPRVVYDDDPKEISIPNGEETQINGDLVRGKKVKRIGLRNIGQGVEYPLLKIRDNKTFVTSRNSFMQVGNKLYIRFHLKAASELIIHYEGEPDPSAPGEDKLLGLGSQDAAKAKAAKYPAVFLKTPNLLDYQNKEFVGDEIAATGFVGYVDSDGLESLTLSLVDARGNLLSQPITYPVDRLIPKEVRYAPNGSVIYQGLAYEFETKLVSPAFLTNIRIEAVTKSGKRGSITRRMFYDSQFPNLTYYVANRQLSDEFMDLSVVAKDDSFRVRVYQNGSYLGGEDLSKKSLELGDVKFQQNWQIPLKVGQNKIELKAVDAGGKEQTKVLYIYRAEK